MELKVFPDVFCTIFVCCRKYRWHLWNGSSRMREHKNII